MKSMKLTLAKTPGNGGHRNWNDHFLNFFLKKLLNCVLCESKAQIHQDAHKNLGGQLMKVNSQSYQIETSN